VKSIVEQCSSSWNYQFGSLKEFRQIHPNRWPKDKEEFPLGNRLGSWCQDQRDNFKKGLLSNERINSLNQLGFKWNPLHDNWVEQFEYLQLFRQLNPHRWPKIKEEFPEDNELGIWCSMQRDAYKNKTLTAQKKELLDSISFPWNIFDERWDN